MNYKLAITTVTLALFTISCTDSEEHEGHDEMTEHATADHDHHDNEHAEEADTESATTPMVTLDIGQRWKANPETTSGIASMIALIDKQAVTPMEAPALKTALEEEFGLIFERCTMTGEAHEQLHNYLIPIHQSFSGFDASNEAQLAEMKTYLGTYGDYFE
ncbi:MAG: hypothetical protein WAR83_08950 [Flavobacteriales bacterium]